MTQLRRPPTGSPFARRIATPTMADGYIKDNSVLKMIENSLYDGALYQYRDPEDGTGDVDQMLLHLNYFWTVVAVTFPDAWELPRRSRAHSRRRHPGYGLRHGRAYRRSPGRRTPGLEPREEVAACASTAPGPPGPGTSAPTRHGVGTGSRTPQTTSDC